MEQKDSYQKLPSGKIIVISYDVDGSILTEKHSYGFLEIGLTRWFQAGELADETYFAKKRLVSRRIYERERLAYPDMPPASEKLEDTGAALIKAAREQSKQNKLDAQHRFETSSAGRFPRPQSTNWIRVTAGEKSHLMLFASRDWKILAKGSPIPSGRNWLNAFGFSGTPGERGSVAKGLEFGFEVSGERELLLTLSKKVLEEVKSFEQSPPPVSALATRIGRSLTPKKAAHSSWSTVLPPLIEFLSEISDPTVMIFNHHR